MNYQSAALSINQTIEHRRCQLFKSGHHDRSAECLLYPRKRTSVAPAAWRQSPRGSDQRAQLVGDECGGHCQWYVATSSATIRLPNLSASLTPMGRLPLLAAAAVTSLPAADEILPSGHSASSIPRSNHRRESRSKRHLLTRTNAFGPRSHLLAGDPLEQRQA